MIFRILLMIHANATNVLVLPQKQNTIYHCIDPRLLTRLFSFICKTTVRHRTVCLVESIRQSGWFEVGSKLRGSFDMTMVATEDLYWASEEHALPFLVKGALSRLLFCVLFSFPVIAKWFDVRRNVVLYIWLGVSCGSMKKYRSLEPPIPLLNALNWL
jgi:hypothetical protein